MKKLCFFILAFMIICGNAFGAIEYRSANFHTNSASTKTNTITKPTGTIDDDVMVAIITCNNSGQTVTPPAGWTSLQKDGTSYGATTEIFWKLASSEGVEYTFTIGTEARNTGVIASFSGCDIADVIDGSTVNNSSSTNQVALGITTGTDNVMLVFLGGLDTSSTRTWTPPSGFDEAIETDSVAPAEISYGIQESQGASGDKTAVISGSSSGISSLVSLNPAAAPTRRIMVIQ